MEEQLVFDTVRTWAEALAPGETLPADLASGYALSALAGGGSVAEALAAGRSVLESWCRHPSHQPARPRLRVA